MSAFYIEPNLNRNFKRRGLPNSAPRIDRKGTIVIVLMDEMMVMVTMMSAASEVVA
jgi:hypothetical protein